jgi:hypothetical protein
MLLQCCHKGAYNQRQNGLCVCVCPHTAMPDLCASRNLFRVHSNASAMSRPETLLRKMGEERAHVIYSLCCNSRASQC